MERIPQPGDRVGEFILEEPLGQGGFGVVWRAHHCLLNRLAAVKIPHPEGTTQLKKEGLFQFTIDHPNVVQILGIDLESNPPYMAMELVEGKNLRKILCEKGHLSWKECLGILNSALMGIAAAHKKGIVHGDLKPENILITDKGEVKVGDFGLGQRHSNNPDNPVISEYFSSSKIGEARGTLDYMSPEVRRQGTPPDARSDVYSIGVILFEMLTGELPQGGDIPSQLQPDIPHGLDEIFKKCYTRVSSRYPDAESLLDAISLFQENILKEQTLQDDKVEPKPVIPASDGTQLTKSSAEEPDRPKTPMPPFIPRFPDKEGFSFAPFWARLAALIIDLMALFFVLFLLFRFRLTPSIVFAFLYFLIYEWIFGATPGKMLFGMRIYGPLASRLDIGVIFWRLITGIILLPLLPFNIFIPSGKKGQALHDLLAGSAVIWSPFWKTEEKSKFKSRDVSADEEKYQS